MLPPVTTTTYSPSHAYDLMMSTNVTVATRPSEIDQSHSTLHMRSSLDAMRPPGPNFARLRGGGGEGGRGERRVSRGKKRAGEDR